jgi:hypothetical protein
MASLAIALADWPFIIVTGIIIALAYFILSEMVSLIEKSSRIATKERIISLYRP